jgi:RNA polymerase sigma-70 factor, ECF subfamily
MPGSPTESDAVAALSPADVRGPSPSSAVEQEVVDLFDRWRDPLLRYLSGCSLAVPDSEDILQETFLALFQHLRRGKSRENLRGWLFRVAHNLALKKLQRTRRDSKNVPDLTIAGDFVMDPGPNPEDQFATSQTQKRLMAVLQALPEHSRCCLYLRAEGLRYREIAEVLDMSLGAVAFSLERSLALITRASQR